MKLEWYKCSGGVWCELFKLDLDHKYFKRMYGVYTLWTISDDKISTLYVGSGDIRKEFKRLVAEVAIQAFKHIGVVCSWAETDNEDAPNIEYFLNETLAPKITGDTPKVRPIEVNLPWDD